VTGGYFTGEEGEFNDRGKAGIVAGLRERLRRYVRGIQRRRLYPLRLPHHWVESWGVDVMGGGRRELNGGQIRALQQADGTRTVSQLARETGVARSWLVEAQENDLLILWRSAVPKESPKLAGPPKAIIVAPHPDDAALSCGGRMLAGQDVLVVNVFSKTAWWRFQMDESDIERIQGCRAMEEAVVSRLSGAEIRGLELPEALLRGHKLDEVFKAAPGKRDRDVIESIKQMVGDLAVKHAQADWFLPLGVGDHIDHRIARDAAREALTAAGVGAGRLHFYEDLPYAAKEKDADFSGKAPGLKLAKSVLKIEEVIGWKVELLRAYWSQFTRGSLEELKDYAGRVGGEVVWEAVTTGGDPSVA
jgi:LmbE family N-acetylglucosaminyl deacetylase